jgi:hypothetical protein
VVTGRRGFTLVETLVSLVVGVFFFLGIVVAFRAAEGLQQAAAVRIPLGLAVGNAATLLRETVRSATCITKPGAGLSGEVLAGWKDADCSGTALGSATPEWFMFCRYSILRYERGTSGSPPEKCSDSSYVLTPVGLAVASSDGGNAFARDAALANVVYARLKFGSRSSSSYSKMAWAERREVTWNSTITARGMESAYR